MIYSCTAPFRNTNCCFFAKPVSSDRELDLVLHGLGEPALTWLVQRWAGTEKTRLIGPSLWITADIQKQRVVWLTCFLNWRLWWHSRAAVILNNVSAWTSVCMSIICVMHPLSHILFHMFSSHVPFTHLYFYASSILIVNFGHYLLNPMWMECQAKCHCPQHISEAW